MPRKSVASLEITSPPPRPNLLPPPPTLSESERNLFVAILGNCGHDHFQQSDLLCRYVEASILAERAAEQLRAAPVVDDKPSLWLVVTGKIGANPYRARHAAATELTSALQGALAPGQGKDRPGRAWSGVVAAQGCCRR